MKTIFTSLLTMLCLTACSGEVAIVTKHHVAMANYKCASNGRRTSIENATERAEIVNCGYKCAKESGKFIYKAKITCGNDATFNLEWVE